jgi:tetrahydromethanopterin S-methyltransferase subunit G
MYIRESWNDDRLDDFAKHVDHRFDEVDKRLDRLEERVDTAFARFDARFDTLQRAVMGFGLGGVVTVVIGFLGLILTHA